MRKTTATIVGAGLALLAGCGGGDGGGDLFQPKPECMGEAVTAYAGMHQQVISKLGIGAAADGFDLDGDGKPDNKLAAVSSIAKSSIDESIAKYDIVIPIEFFDLPAAAADTCVKFAIYLGKYVVDADADGEKPYIDGGDCNDLEATIRPGNAEVPGNFRDDDCDGLADDDADVASTDTADRDGDGQSMADGDCDDTLASVKKGAVEICGDGLDNDCDGVADRTGGMVATACSPFDPTALQDVPLDPLSFANGEPVITFKDGVITEKNGARVLTAGPSLFSVRIPVALDIALDLRITGAQIEAKVVEENGKLVLREGRLGGVLDSKTADTIRGLDVSQIGLKPEDSLLDATFANLLGPLLALPKADEDITKKYLGCRTPDIDVDRDGLEAYCDSNPDDDIKIVDVCIDGDGTEIRDMGAVQCTEAVKDGKPRFIDGISVELNFETTPLKAIKPPR
ncbi:MAG: putative metal-binding motif-containing protein [Deltaproteobacteria bacterium]|nr:putative metal-binding motif-containing protein [Deltaproteobacteria bacterium]MDQ3296372.1 putative metal-binding motif-containing protein [Myxococcota bacterium]